MYKSYVSSLYLSFCIRDGQKPDFFQNPGFGFNSGSKMKNPGFSG